MLRITVLNDTREATFKIEGKLTDEWVAEAEKAWSAFSNTRGQERVVVDLCGVSFVDDPGRELLARMHASGAKLTGKGPMTSALIEEICREGSGPGKKWIRIALSLFFLQPLAMAVPNKNNTGNRLGSLALRHTSAMQEWVAAVHPAGRFLSLLTDQLAIGFRKGLSR